MVAGANGVAAGSSLARPRHRWWKVPVKIGWKNFHRWRHYLKLVKILPNFTCVFSDENSMVRHPVCSDPPSTATKYLCWSRRRNACLLDVAAIRICRVRTRWLSWIMTLVAYRAGTTARPDLRNRSGWSALYAFMVCDGMRIPTTRLIRVGWILTVRRNVSIRYHTLLLFHITVVSRSWECICEKWQVFYCLCFTPKEMCAALELL